MKNRVLGIVLAATMGLGLITGCGASSTTSTTSADTASETATVSSGKIVYISRSMSDQFASWLANTVKEKGESEGYSVSIMDSEDDGTKCVEMLENAINTKPDAIIIQPTSDAQVLSTIQNAEEQGIKVVVVNVTLSEDPDAVPTIVCDDYTLAYTVGSYAAEVLPENANVVILGGITGFSVSVDRDNGFADALAERSDITVLSELDCDFDKAEAMKAMDDWLQKYDNIDAVISQNDGMVLGAIESYKSNNVDYSDVMFFGIDGLADGCLSVKDGELTATVLQDANAMADEALKMVDGLIDGSITDVQMISVDPALINAENVDDYIAMHKESGLISE